MAEVRPGLGVITAGVLAGEIAAAAWTPPVAALIVVPTAALALWLAAKRWRGLGWAALAATALTLGATRMRGVTSPVLPPEHVARLALPLATALEGRIVAAPERHACRAPGGGRGGGPRRGAPPRQRPRPPRGPPSRPPLALRRTAAGRDHAAPAAQLRQPGRLRLRGTSRAPGRARDGLAVERRDAGAAAGAGARLPRAPRALARAARRGDGGRGGAARGRGAARAHRRRRGGHRRRAARRVHARRRGARALHLRAARRPGRGGGLRARPLAPRAQRAPPAPRRLGTAGGGAQPRAGGALHGTRRPGRCHPALGGDGRRSGRGGAPRPAGGRAPHARARGAAAGARLARRAARDRLPALLRVGGGDRVRDAAPGA